MRSCKQNVAQLFTVLALSSVLAGCSWLRIDTVSDSVDYRGNSGSIAPLEVPPGLSSPSFDTTYTINKPVSAVEIAQTTQQATVNSNPANISVPLSSTLTKLKDGNPVLAVLGRYEQVWSSTGLALGRMGLSLAGQQYDQGVYTVSTKAANKEEQGVLNRLMSFFKGEEKSVTTYRFIIGDQGKQSLIVVSDAAGVPLKAEEATALLTQLKSALNP